MAPTSLSPQLDEARSHYDQQAAHLKEFHEREQCLAWNRSFKGESAESWLPRDGQHFIGSQVTTSFDL